MRNLNVSEDLLSKDVVPKWSKVTSFETAEELSTYWRLEGADVGKYDAESDDEGGRLWMSVGTLSFPPQSSPPLPCAT